MNKIVFILVTTLLCSSLFAKEQTKATVVGSAVAVTNGVKVQWNESGTVEVKMLTARGQVVKSYPRMMISAGSQSIISFDKMSPGIYYMTINTGRSIQKIAFAR